MSQITRRSLAFGTLGALGLGSRAWADAATPEVTIPAKMEMLAGRRTIRHLPAKPRGVIYVLHGSGGSEMFATRLHTKRVLRGLIARGYGYVSPPSLQREPPTRWAMTSADPAVSPDIAYMLDLHRALIAAGEIKVTTPVFTMGMSNGGGFANLWGAAAKVQGLPVRAIADYMGPVPQAVAPVMPDLGKFPPLFAVLGTNDGLVHAANVEPVIRRIAAAGAKVELHIVTEQRVTAETFRDIPGLTAADRASVVEALVGRGVIDKAGARLVFKDRPLIDRPEIAQLNTMMPPGDNGRAVAAELLIAWGSHQMRSDFADAQLAFFEAALAG